MKVNILTSPTYKAYMVNYPVRAFSKQLQSQGVEVTFFYFETKKLYHCDVLILCSDAFRKTIRKYTRLPDRHEFLGEISKTNLPVIWFDTGDSTGITLFDVMPFVNLYLKPQILKDRSNYLKNYYGELIYSDYYHSQFRVENKVEVIRPALDPQYLSKIDCAWNFGLNNFSRNVKSRLHKIHWAFPKNYHSVKFLPPESLRTVDVSYHISAHNSVNTIAFQRKQVLEILEKMQRETGLNLSISGRLSPKEFKQELMASKILPAPFGFGEITPRDFEAFIYGAALLKPDMSVVETWPNYYLANQTYIPFAWDFSDLEEKLFEYLEEHDKRLAIAARGQQVYKESISEAGGNQFAERFKRLMVRAEKNQ